jgi:hypothetical protein
MRIVIGSLKLIEVKVVFLLLILSLVFSPFGFIGEGAVLLKQLWILFLFLFLLTGYSIWLINRGYKLSAFELYVLLIIVATPIWSSVTAGIEFGQPILYGILSQRDLILCAGALFILFLVRKGYINIYDVERAIVLLSWSCLIIFTLFSLIADPNHYADKVFVGGENIGEAFFKYNIYLIIFGFYYYLYLGYKKQGSLNYLYAILFLLFIILGDGGRVMLLAVFSSMLFFLYRWGALTKLIILLPKLMVMGVIVLILSLAINEQLIIDLPNKFGNAFSVMVTGEKGDDVSANARILEVLLVEPYIKESLWFGNGNISNRWNNGFEGVLGGYFYPADIGILGSIFVHGILGSILFSIQFVFAWSFTKRSLVNTVSPLENAIKAFLLYFALHSLANGRFILAADISLFMVMLLGLSYRNQLTRSS